VLTVILILLLLALALTVLLWVGTVSIQGYFYNEVSPDLIWRAPAAALAVTLYIGFWCWFTYGSPRGAYGSLFYFDAPSEEERFAYLVWVKKDHSEVRYHWNGSNWVDDAGRPFRRSTSEEMVEELRAEPKDKESGKSVVFKADLTSERKFKNPAQYIEEGGARRVMTEDSLGRVSTPKRGLEFANLLLNGLHFVVWFLVLWLLLRFQWSHALGLALPLWLALSLTAVPFLLARTSGS
jgi:hypothetical protein